MHAKNLQNGLEVRSIVPESLVGPRTNQAFTDWVTKLTDPARLAALAATGLLERSGDGFGSWTRLAARLLDTPVALISFIDDQRQILKSFHGLGDPWASSGEAPLSHSLCKYVVAGGESLVLGDVRELPELRDNPGVREGGVVAYMGVPLKSTGEAIGTFCVFDNQPRRWSEDDLAMLEEFARSIENQIALSVANAELGERERVLERVLNLLPTGVVLRDVEGKVMRTNPALAQILGRSEETLKTTDFWEITHPDDLQADMASRAELLRGEREVATCTKRCLHSDGHYVWTRLSASVLRDPKGKVQGTIAVVEDVTAERNAAAALAHQAHVYAAIAHNIPRGAVLMYDHDLRYVAADGPELLMAAGLKKSELEGHTLKEVVRPETYSVVERMYREALAGKSSEFDGERNGRSFHARIAPIWEGDRVAAGLVFVQDVTEERRQQEAVRRSKSLFEATIGHIRDGVALMDSGWNVLLANRAFAELFALSDEQLVGLNRERFLEHVSKLAEDPSVFLTRTDVPGSPAPGRVDEFVLARPRRRIVRRTRSALELPDGSGHGYLAIWEDITAERALMNEREREALTDQLTGIANRRAAERAMASALAASERSKQPLSIALFDVDHFKQINDRFGHALGDDVLKIVAACLTREARATDTVARWGGEEFVAVLPVAGDGAIAFCERVRKAIEATPFPSVGRVTISAGVAELGPNEEAEHALSRADTCLYAAKSAGRNRVSSR
ncbi:MAG: diguanylate cyclase [Polyangiaceae bacterium]